MCELYGGPYVGRDHAEALAWVDSGAELCRLSKPATPPKDAQRTLLDLEYIVEQLADFYEPQEARLWLYSRQKLLNAAISAELIRDGKAQEVIAVIDQLSDSVHV